MTASLCVLSISIIILCAGVGDAANRFAGSRYRRDIIESSASNEQPSTNDANVSETDALLTADNDNPDEIQNPSKDVIDHDNNINSIGTKENASTTANIVKTSTDANNVIEQVFDAAHTHDGSVLPSANNNTTEVGISNHSVIGKGSEFAHDKPDNRENQ